MNVSEVSRLSVLDSAQNIYLTIAVGKFFLCKVFSRIYSLLLFYSTSLDAIPWISLCQKDDAMIMTLEITMTKLKQTQLGVIFRQETGLVVVDSVTTNSCAYHAGLRPSDVVIFIINFIAIYLFQICIV